MALVVGRSAYFADHPPNPSNYLAFSGLIFFTSDFDVVFVTRRLSPRIFFSFLPSPSGRLCPRFAAVTSKYVTPVIRTDSSDCTLNFHPCIPVVVPCHPHPRTFSTTPRSALTASLAHSPPAFLRQWRRFSKFGLLFFPFVPSD